jgi:nucleotide-binding universal stress UspA family protein
VRDILLATDGSESAAAASRVAVELAQATGDRLLVVTAWRELRGDFGVPLSSVFPDVADIERNHAGEVAEAAAAVAIAAGVEAEAVLRHGPPSREICAVARERAPRLIVIGSQGWGMVERAVFGSVSESVLHHAPCPVLVVPADDVLARRADSGSAR